MKFFSQNTLGYCALLKQPLQMRGLLAVSIYTASHFIFMARFPRQTLTIRLLKYKILICSMLSFRRRIILIFYSNDRHAIQEIHLMYMYLFWRPFLLKYSDNLQIHTLGFIICRLQFWYSDIHIQVVCNKQEFHNNQVNRWSTTCLKIESLPIFGFYH